MLLWSPYVIGQAIIFSSCGFFLLSFFFFSLPNLSSRRLDVYHASISTHGVALVRIQNAGLKCAARGSLKMHDEKKITKNLPSGHHHATSLGYIFATKARTDNWKLVKQQYLFHVSPQYGELRH